MLSPADPKRLASCAIISLQDRVSGDSKIVPSTLVSKTRNWFMIETFGEVFAFETITINARHRDYVDTYDRLRYECDWI